MSKYKENPKTKGSGVVCVIPQTGTCPNSCEDCFFQSGRSYLEPLVENLPNIASPTYKKPVVVRVNDGNDSNVDKRRVIETTQGKYPMKFYNTAIPELDFPGPVVLTVNPGKMTDRDFHRIETPPKNLMFVRFRANTWNRKLCNECIDYYSSREVSIVLTFMAYFNMCIPTGHEGNYIFRKRTLNSYWAITTKAWREVIKPHENNKWVYSCGKIEGELGDTHCRFCGNCLREYFVAITRMEESKDEIHHKD